MRAFTHDDPNLHRVILLFENEYPSQCTIDLEDLKAALATGLRRLYNDPDPPFASSPLSVTSSEDLSVHLNEPDPPFSPSESDDPFEFQRHEGQDIIVAVNMASIPLSSQVDPPTLIH